MAISGPKIFKLNFDGSFDNIAYENIKDAFKIVNILAIYVTQKKTMYIWIGKKASQSLKNHISNIRVLVKEEFPDFRILRNNTVEMRDEPYDFFQNLNINKEELYKQIDYQEKILLPILKNIDNLRDKSEKFIKTTNYEDALKITKDIIELAKKVGDEALIAEQEKQISELRTKSETKKIIDEIANKTTEVEKNFSNLIEKKEYLKANSILAEFKKEIGLNYDSTQVAPATEFIVKGEKILRKEQGRLQKELTKLENDLFVSLKNFDLDIAADIMREGNSLLLNLINEEIKTKWKTFDDDLENAKLKAELTKIIDKFFTENKILKETYQFKEIKIEIKKLLTRVKKLNFTDYQKKLESFEKEILSAEENYNKNLAEIVGLEKLIKENQANNLLDDILKNCEKILKIADSINKSDITESYTTIVKQTESSIEENRLFEENQNKLKQELSTLEKSLTSALKNFEISKASEIIEKGNKNLHELIDENIKKQWVSLKEDFITAKKKKELMDKIDIFIEESNELKNNFKFEELNSNIENFMSHLKELKLPNYLKKIEKIKSTVTSIREEYNKTQEKIKDLEVKVEESQQKKLLDDTVGYCEDIIKFAKAIKKSDLIKKYSTIIELTNQAIEKRRIFEEKQRELEQELSSLEKDFLSSLKIMQLEKVGEIIQKGKVALVELVDEEIKKKWVEFENKYLKAESFIETIENLSKNGLQALETKEYEESLKFYKQIVEQIESYES
ncbi:MAG TPA: hypothetical protein ENI29_03435 [bacterium]|nr:hypothetical protein [bacterium]